MRTLYKAVAVGALALGFTGCSQDPSGPDVGPQFSGWGQIQNDTGVVSTTQSPGNLPQCAWDALLRADNQIDGKGNCRK